VPTERRPANTAANNTQGPASSSNANWGPWVTGNAGLWRYWSQATGQFTGTTDELMELAACRWGWNEDWIRAEAVRESAWMESQQGDTANGCDHSFSILQIRDTRNTTCPIDHDGLGGMPYTQQSTPLAIDAFASYMRSCVDGMAHPTAWYGGKTVGQWAASNDWNYVRWGCVGSWFSGDWYSTGAQGYISRVQQALASKTWTTY
jgi:autotransporter family porin